MHLGFDVRQEQAQKLVMTPELRMAIKILQYSIAELAEFIDQQLLENPVLEVAEEREESVEETAAEEIRSRETDADKVDIDWEQYFEDVSDLRKEKIITRETEGMRYDGLLSEVPTLQNHLLMQLGLATLNEQEKNVGEFIIGSIDDNGYLHCALDEVVVQTSLPLMIVEKVLKIVQGFDPAGVGARDLRESLLIQYEQLELKNDILKYIIGNHLQEIAEGKIMKVAKKIGVSLTDMQEAIDNLKLMEPKPGRKFSPSGDTRYIIPDIMVEKVQGEYIVLVNDVTVPRLTVNPFYKEIMSSRISDQESRKYLEDKLNSAVWLMKSIEKRRMTLYKVARCIVDFQEDFLEKGIKHLRTMNLKKVAEAIGVHESTVSRATVNKYMQTPKGVFEIKFFFTGGITGSRGIITSAEVIKKMIFEMIEGEDQKKPLSDEKISQMLNLRGIEISRRTVAKYRNEMGISSTTRRRRY
jgi:RNA polymerase sigma-54 factor